MESDGTINTATIDTDDHDTEDAGLLELSAIDAASLTDAELRELIIRSENVARQAKADQLELCGQLRQRGGRLNGVHRNHTLWMADQFHMLKGTAGSMLKRGSLMFVTHPEIGAAFRSGLLGEHHLDLFQRLWNKKPLREFLACGGYQAIVHQRRAAVDDSRLILTEVGGRADS